MNLMKPHTVVAYMSGAFYVFQTYARLGFPIDCCLCCSSNVFDKLCYLGKTHLHQQSFISNSTTAAELFQLLRLALIIVWP